MRYCSSCGAEVQEYSSYCPRCGSPLNNVNYNMQRPYPVEYDTGGAWWAVLGFLVPLVGLILFLVWMDTKPNSAKMAGIGALISVISSIILVPVVFLIVMMMASASSGVVF